MGMHEIVGDPNTNYKDMESVRGNRCPQCDGFGELFGLGCPGLKPVSFKCDLCAGTGVIDDKQRLWRLQGQKLKDRRIKMGISLRRCAKRYKLDAGNLSKMERGVIKPYNYFGKTLRG